MKDLPQDMMRQIAAKLAGPDCASLAQTSRSMLAVAAAPLLHRLHDAEFAPRHQPQAVLDLVTGLFATLRPASAAAFQPEAQRAFLDLWNAAVLRLHALPSADRPDAFARLRDSLAGLLPAEHAARLATLMDRLGDLPADARAPMFAGSLAAIRRDLPAGHRALPLGALLKRVDTLCGPFRLAGDGEPEVPVSAIGEALAELPEEHRAGPLAALLGRIPELPPIAAQACYQAGHRWMDSLPPASRAEPLAALLERFALSVLAHPESPRPSGPPGFAQSIAPVAELPAEQRGILLAVLIRELHDPGRFPAEPGKSVAVHDWLCSMIGTLPPEQQAVPLAQWLAMCQERSVVSDDRVVAEYERGQALVSGLPPQYRSEPLAALMLTINRLPEHTRDAEYAEGRRRVAELPPQDRGAPLAALLDAQIQNTAGDVPLAVLWGTIPGTPAQRAALHAWYGQGGYEEGLSLAAELPPSSRAEVLYVLLASIRSHVPPERRDAEYRRGLRLVAELPPQHRADVLSMLLAMMRYAVVPEKRADEYQEGLRRVAELPLEQRGGPLRALLKSLNVHPAPDCVAEYERALHLAGLPPPDHRGGVPEELAHQLMASGLILRFPEADRAQACLRTLGLMGEKAEHRIDNNRERRNRDGLMHFIAHTS